MKDYLIWTNHGEGSSAPYTARNPANINANDPDMFVDGCQFVHETQHNCPQQSEHVVPDVHDDVIVGGTEGNRTHVADKADEEFMVALLRRHTDPSMFFMKGMEALEKAAAEPFYDESKGCTKEFMTLRSVLKL